VLRIVWLRAVGGSVALLPGYKSRAWASRCYLFRIAFSSSAGHIGVMLTECSGAVQQRKGERQVWQERLGVPACLRLERRTRRVDSRMALQDVLYLASIQRLSAAGDGACRHGSCRS